MDAVGLREYRYGRPAEVLRCECGMKYLVKSCVFYDWFDGSRTAEGAVCLACECALDEQLGLARADWFDDLEA